MSHLEAAKIVLSGLLARAPSMGKPYPMMYSQRDFFAAIEQLKNVEPPAYKIPGRYTLIAAIAAAKEW
jgi:hypothetical protein